MSTPLSLRLPDDTRDGLDSRARRTHVPPRTLAQRYIAEGLRHDEHPLIHFIDGPAGRRAAVLGTGLDVWEAIVVVRDNDGDVTEAAEYLELPAHLIQAAVNYYAAYREEIDEWIDSNAREAEKAHAAWLAGRHVFDRE